MEPFLDKELVKPIFNKKVAFVADARTPVVISNFPNPGSVLVAIYGHCEKPVRASAVRRSKGAGNWPRGRPGPLWARTNPRYVWEASERKSPSCLNAIWLELDFWLTPGGGELFFLRET